MPKWWEKKFYFSERSLRKRDQNCPTFLPFLLGECGKVKNSDRHIENAPEKS